MARRVQYDHTLVDPTSLDPNLSVFDSTAHDNYQTEWYPDKAPSIEDRFWNRVIPVQMTPSDRVSFYTYNFVTGAVDATGQPTRIVNRQPEGVASKVRIQNVSTAASQDVMDEPRSIESVFKRPGTFVVDVARSSAVMAECSVIAEGRTHLVRAEPRTRGQPHGARVEFYAACGRTPQIRGSPVRRGEN